MWLTKLSEETVTFNLELNVEKAFSNARRLETLLYRTLGLLRRLGLPENIEQGIYRLQRMVMTIRLAHTALIALQAASGPIGWAFAGVGVATAAFSASELAMELGY